MAEQLLMNAVAAGDMQQVSTLIVETNANINFVDESNRGFTPCHLAAENGLMSVLELLLTFNCDPNVPSVANIGSLTPLHIATSKGYKKIVETLLNYYADPNIQDSNGFTPLHIACRKGFVEIAKLLLSKGTDIELKDEQGKTAYYWAKEYRHDDILPYLEVMAFHSMKEPPQLGDPASELKAKEKLAFFDWTKHHDETKVTINIIVKKAAQKKKKKVVTKKKQ